MNRSLFSHRLVAMLVAFSVSLLALMAGVAAAQSIGQLEGEVSGLSGQMSAAESNPSTADQVIARLDAAEGNFAKLTSSGKADKGALIPIFHQLESMLDRLEKAYSDKKDKCIAEIDNGGQCDYDQPEQLALKAAYPLSWLRFTAATTLFDDNAEQSKKLLNQSIDGFTASMLAMPDPNLIRENTLGRAYCERELGKFDHSEYDHAIADFKKIMDDGTSTQQYKAARQGMSTTYMKMGKPEEAAKFGEEGGTKTSGGQMLQLQTLFSAEQATSDPAKRTQYHQQILDVMKSKENDKEGWAVDVAAASKYPKNAVEEFGNSNDPFEKWLLAAVLLSRKDETGAVKYYAEACDTGKYPKACRFAAEIYQREKRYDQVQLMYTKIAASGGGDASEAVFLKYSLDHDRWQKSGQKDAALESQWVKDAQDYLQKNPNGPHAAELQVALADRLQRQGDLVGAAEMYSKVKGAPEFTFIAKFKAAECYYKQLVGAAATAKDKKDNKAPTIDTEQLRKLALSDLNESIKMGPEAERAANSAVAKKEVREIRGEATYMLASILEADQEHVDYAQVAPLLVGYESNYPSMNAKFQDVVEWRITALDHLGRYDEVNRDVAALVERSKGNTNKSDFIKTLGIDFWHAAKEAHGNGDEKAYQANAKLTITAYKYFADMAAAGKIPVKNLTGTLSIYAQALQATNQNEAADTIFQEVVKADPGSPDANAGLARIAQAKKDWKDGVTLWTTVESTAAESDPLFYEAKYNIAVINNEQGNTPGACDKLRQTRIQHPTLGSPEMLAQWDKLQKKLCLDHRAP